MPADPNIQFDREGGFRWLGAEPNPYAIPVVPPPPTKRWFSWKQLSAEGSIYGSYFVSSHIAVQECGGDRFTRIDRGSLFRIADAVEQMARSISDLTAVVKSQQKEIAKLAKFFGELQARYETQLRDHDAREDRLRRKPA